MGVEVEFILVFGPSFHLEHLDFYLYFFMTILTILKGIFSISCDLSSLNLIVYNNKKAPHLCKNYIL